MWIKTVSERLVNSKYLKQVELTKCGDGYELIGFWTDEEKPNKHNSVIISRGNYDFCAMVRRKIVGMVLPGGQQEKAKGENEKA